MLSIILAFAILKLSNAAWHGQCATGACTGVNINDCTGCKTNAQLASGSPSQCICDSNAVGLPDSSNCVLCHTDCQTCTLGNGQNQCTSCHNNASLQGPSPNYCVWDNGYYSNGGVDNCTAWDNLCATWSGGGANQWLSWKANAEIDTLNPGTCICSWYFWPNTDAANCANCDNTCRTWQNALSTTCTACMPNASLTSGTVNTCEWDDEFWPNLDAGNCSACDPTWFNCIGSASNLWTDWHPNATLTAGSPSTWACDSDAYPDPDARSCPLWDLTWGACQSSNLATDCTGCKTNASLNGLAPTDCLCNSDSWANTDASNWVLCDDSCLTCQGAGTANCMLCKTNATLTAGPPGTCQCDNGYFGDPHHGNCTLCDPLCFECDGGTAADWTACYADAVLSAGVGSAWQCADNFWPNTNVASWSPCDLTWWNWISAAATDCNACYTNAELVSGVINEWKCSDTFWTSTDVANCIPCSAECGNWVAGTNTDCTTWPANAQLIAPGTPPTSWECSDNYFPNSTTEFCTPWHATCLRCGSASASDCTACQANAELSAGANSACVCSDGYWPSPDAASCQTWHLTCLTCDLGNGINQCTDCLANADLNGGPTAVPTNWLCDNDFYAFPDAASWAQWFPDCETCTGSNDTDCITCDDPAAFVDTNGRCVCSDRYYPSNTNPLQCSICDQRCYNCSSNTSTDCTSWVVGGSLVSSPGPSACECDEAYFLDVSQNPDACTPCHADCMECFSTFDFGCTDCWPDATLNGNSCECDIGKYQNPEANNCTDCHDDWYKCQVAGQSSWDECHANASLSATPGTCTCDDGYISTPHAGNCQPCHATCYNCAQSNDQNQWTACPGGSTLTPPGVGQWICDPGYFKNDNICEVCTDGCLTCENDSDDCLTCEEWLYLLVDLTSKQKCVPVCGERLWESQDLLAGGVCAEWDSGCLQCSGSGADECTDWDEDLYLTPTNQCTSCPSGTYKQSLTIWAAWNPECAECSDFGVCNQWAHANKVPDGDGTCYVSCGYGQYVLGDNWNECKSECASCEQRASNCQSCIENADIVPVSPFNECVWSQYYSIDVLTRTCVYIGDTSSHTGAASSYDATNSQTSVTSDDGKNYTLTITFSELVTDLNYNPPDNDNFKIYAEGISPNDYSFEVSQDGKEIELEFEFDSEITSDTDVVVTYVDLINENQGQVEDQKVVTFKPVEEDPALAEAKQIGEATTAGTGTIISVIGFLGLMSGDLGATFSLINTMQVIAFIPLSGIELPIQIQYFYRAFLEMDFPNIFEYILDDDQFGGQGVHYEAAQFGFDNRVFLINGGEQIWTYIFILFLYPMFYGIYSFAKWKRVKNKMLSWMADYKYSVLVRLWMEIYLEIGIATGLQLWTLSFDNPTLFTNAWLGVFTFSVMSITPFAVLAFNVFNRQEIYERDEELKKHYGVLFLEFEPEKRWFGLLYYFIFFSRRLIYIFIQLALYDMPELQLSLNLMHSIGMAYYVWKFRPHIGKMERFINILTECVTVFWFSTLILYFWDYSADMQLLFIWVIMWVVFAMIFIVVGCGLYSQYQQLRQYCGRRRAKTYDMQVLGKDKASIDKSNLNKTEIDKELPTSTEEPSHFLPNQVVTVERTTGSVNSLLNEQDSLVPPQPLTAPRQPPVTKNLGEILGFKDSSPFKDEKQMRRRRRVYVPAVKPLKR